MGGKGQPPRLEAAPTFPLRRNSPFGLGVGNAALTAYAVAVPIDAVRRVRFLDWSHPEHLDVPVSVRVTPQRNWIEPYATAGNGNEPDLNAWAQSFRGTIAYAAGVQKVVEKISMMPNGIVWCGTAREVVVSFQWNQPGFEAGDVEPFVVSIAPQHYGHQRWRQGGLQLEGEEIIPVAQRIPYGATRYRASVSPWGLIANIEWRNFALTVIDSVPALAVADWQVIPSEYAAWAQDAASLNPGVGIGLVTLEFE